MWRRNAERERVFVHLSNMHVIRIPLGFRAIVPPSSNPTAEHHGLRACFIFRFDEGHPCHSRVAGYAKWVSQHCRQCGAHGILKVATSVCTAHCVERRIEFQNALLAEIKWQFLGATEGNVLDENHALISTTLVCVTEFDQYIRVWRRSRSIASNNCHVGDENCATIDLLKDGSSNVRGARDIGSIAVDDRIHLNSVVSPDLVSRLFKRILN